ncbi:M42 family metallopeptidase [Feifania hominis]|uniref:M42 family peptidase n=1 Tax=Feifania hominis TaxID=2763660 RepID=A0A926DDL7_9FIRM|nr:M42 family peptidase [Feifania hominis]MBC8536663.1 M42 family peptidase [Feifania hominis]
MKTLTHELSDLYGICSREDRVIDYMSEHFAPLGGEVSVDTLGNVTCAFSCGRENARRLLVFAHTDEIGFVVTKVEQNGFLRIQRMGGVNTSVLAGIRVTILGERGDVTGNLGVCSHHVMPPELKGVIPDVSKLYIDIGAASAEEVYERGVDVGCFVTYEKNFTELSEHLVSGKALDDRAGCAILLHYAERIAALRQAGQLHWDVYVVACVQEEFNVRGILPRVREIRPDASIGIDICVAHDTPELEGKAPIRLGGGPAVTFVNFHGRGTLAGVLPDEKLQRALLDTCRREKIPFQREVVIGLITENAFIGFENAGVAVANVSYPCRYSHSPIETVDLRDLEGMVSLLAGFTAGLTEQTAFGKQK